MLSDGSLKRTGLGLSTVYGIVKQSDGYIWASSELGNGTTFKSYLRRIEAPAAVMALTKSEVALSQGLETVLVVEDDSPYSSTGKGNP